MSETLLVAVVGKKHGLKGEQKLHIKSDFPEQFAQGALFQTKLGELNIEYFDSKRSIVKFTGVNTPEDATRLTNTKLYSSKEISHELISLEDGEFFWFDIIGCDAFDGSIRLGEIYDIERIGSTDYIMIKTDSQLISSGNVKEFMIPYIERYIVNSDIVKKRVVVDGGLELLEFS